MSKLIIALIAATFATAAAAQTGTFSAAKDADHGTPAMHAAETAKNVQASKAVTGLPADAKTRQQVAKDVTAGGSSSSAGAVASARGAATAKARAAGPTPLATAKEKQVAVSATTKANATP